MAFQCMSCGNAVSALVYVDARYSHDNSYIKERVSAKIDTVYIILPAIVEIDDSIPEKSRNYLKQATDSLHAPDGAIMLAAASVDAMLKEKGLEKGSLYERIEQAVQQQILTKDMGEWAHAVRLESNKPRHADKDDPHATRDQSQQVIDFARALGEFLFVLPSRIKAGKEAAEGAGAA